jgi:hypothetical protein
MTASTQLLVRIINHRGWSCDTCHARAVVDRLKGGRVALRATAS